MMVAVREALTANHICHRAFRKTRSILCGGDIRNWLKKEGLTGPAGEVLRLLAEGRLMKAVAYILNMKIRTVAITSIE
jgi:DNA-binding NarL/FixJ family response regulator